MEGRKGGGGGEVGGVLRRRGSTGLSLVGCCTASRGQYWLECLQKYNLDDKALVNKGIKGVTQLQSYSVTQLTPVSHLTQLTSIHNNLVNSLLLLILANLCLYSTDQCWYRCYNIIKWYNSVWLILVA